MSSPRTALTKLDMLDGGCTRSIGRTGRQAGLTLVEMLVALVLSSIIFISAYQVISNLIQYQVRASAKHSGQADKLLIANLLSQVIEMGMNQYDLYYRNQKSTLFQGSANSMQILSRAYSNHYDKPSYRLYRLYRRDGELYVSYRAFDRDFLANERFDLATGLKIERLEFAYLDQGEWVNEWNRQKEIPEFVRVRVELANFASSEWIRGTSQR